MTTELAVRMNNVSSRALCALCGAEKEVIVPHDIFIEGTFEPVCDDCVRYWKPALLDERQRLLDEFAAGFEAETERLARNGPVLSAEQVRAFHEWCEGG